MIRRLAVDAASIDDQGGSGGELRVVDLRVIGDDQDRIHGVQGLRVERDRAQGREIGMFMPYDAEGFIPNAPFTWGPQPFKEHIFFSDWNSGLWAVKLKDPERPDRVIGEPQ